MDGAVSIGTSISSAKLTVKRKKDELNTPGSEDYVAVFENEGLGDSDGIAVILHKNNPTTSENNFMTFIRRVPGAGGDHVVGRIEGFDKNNDGDWTAPPSIFGNLNVNFKTSGFDDLSAPSVSMSNKNINILGVNYTVPNLTSLSFDQGWVSKSGMKTLFSGIGSGEFLTFSGLPNQARMTELIEWGFKNNVQSFIKADPAGIAMAAIMKEATKHAKHEGITYGSKGADYAEWLPKLDPNERFQFGEIVGVHGGRISKKTEGADQILAISLAPIVLGNMPPVGEESNYEKVGFMGQVPVVVKGTVERGDYILASGLEDGTGIAISPDDIELKHLENIVGIAWSESANDIGGFINVAIGLSTHEWVKIFSQQQSTIDLHTSENKQLKETTQALTTRLELIESKSVITASLQEENQRLKSDLHTLQSKVEAIELAFRRIQQTIPVGMPIQESQEAGRNVAINKATLTFR